MSTNQTNEAIGAAKATMQGDIDEIIRSLSTIAQL